MAESQEDKAARQARLSKALSAAYLSHQITQLEDKVHGTEAGKRSGSPNTNRGAGRGGHRGNGQGGRGGGGGGSAKGRERGHGGQAGHARGSAMEREKNGAQPPRRVVLDASALLFALPRLRNLIKNQAEVVVPLEALNTLDLLKKSMHNLSVKARQATRFIEDAQEKARHQARQQGDLDEFEPGQYRQGLWIQDEMETDNNLGWEPLAEIRADGGELGQEANEQREEGMPTYVASTLQCASFFRHIWEIPEDAAILVICPETIDTADGQAEQEEESHIVRFGDRARGHAMKQWAEIMGIGCLDFTASKEQKGSHPSARENVNRVEAKTMVKQNGTIATKPPGQAVLTGPALTLKPSLAVRPPQAIRLLRPDGNNARPQSPVPPPSPQKRPTSPARGGLTKEALERSQALLEAQELEEAAKRREASEMHRVQNEQRRGLEHCATNGTAVRPPGGAPITLLTRPRGQDVNLLPGGHGRAPAKLDTDGIKLLRPDPNQPISVLPRQPSRGAGKADGWSSGPPPVKAAGQVKEKAPPFVLLQRPK